MLGQRLRGIVIRRIPCRFPPFKGIRQFARLSTQYYKSSQMVPVLLGLPRMSRRNYGATAAAFVPKSYFFRLFWTFVTGTVGFVYYKLSGTYFFASI